MDIFCILMAARKHIVLCISLFHAGTESISQTLLLWRKLSVQIVLIEHFYLIFMDKNCSIKN